MCTMVDLCLTVCRVEIGLYNIMVDLCLTVCRVEIGLNVYHG